MFEIRFLCSLPTSLKNNYVMVYYNKRLIIVIIDYICICWLHIILKSYGYANINNYR